MNWNKHAYIIFLSTYLTQLNIFIVYLNKALLNVRYDILNTIINYADKIRNYTKNKIQKHFVFLEYMNNLVLEIRNVFEFIFSIVASFIRIIDDCVQNVISDIQ